MTLTISVRNYLRVQKADLSVSPMALLCGGNGAGKSSFIAATQAALSGEPLLGMVTKAQAGQIVHDGAERGAVTVHAMDADSAIAGLARIVLPSCDVATEGKPPHASKFATGQSSLVDLDAKERAKAIGTYLKAEPTKRDLAAFLRASGVPFQTQGVALESEVELMRDLGLNQTDVAIYRGLSKAWEWIESTGWDGAHKQAAEFCTKAKGAWEQVTTTKYGSQKAAQWVPDGWDAMPTHNHDDAIHARDKADDTLKAAIRADASRSADIDKWRSIVSEETARKNALTVAAADADKLEKALRSLANKATPKVPARPIECPHCGEPVVILSTKDKVELVKSEAPPVPEEEMVAAEKRRDEHVAAVEKARADYEAALDVKNAAQEAIYEFNAAARELAEIGGASGDRKVPDGTMTIEDATTALANANMAVAAIERKAAADRKHREVAATQAMVDALSPTGLRKAALAKAVGTFNGALAAICKRAKWAPVTLDESLNIFLGSRSYAQCSAGRDGSNKMRVRIVLQLAMAQMDQSDLVLVDAADMLDMVGRNGLFAALKHVGIPAVVTMTMPSPDRCPDLAKMGMGNSYWVSDGITVSLAEAVAAKEKAA